MQLIGKIVYKLICKTKAQLNQKMQWAKNKIIPFVVNQTDVLD